MKPESTLETAPEEMVTIRSEATGWGKIIVTTHLGRLWIGGQFEIEGQVVVSETGRMQLEAERIDAIHQDQGIDAVCGMMSTAL